MLRAQLDAGIASSIASDGQSGTAGSSATPQVMVPFFGHCQKRFRSPGKLTQHERVHAPAEIGDRCAGLCIIISAAPTTSLSIHDSSMHGVRCGVLFKRPVAAYQQRHRVGHDHIAISVTLHLGSDSVAVGIANRLGPDHTTRHGR